MAARGIGLVFGGGRVGLMGAVATSVLEHGGEVTGVIPHGLKIREVAHDGVLDMRIVDSMHERKALMNELSDAFISLPGGLGTIEETAEMLTWAQLGIHRKPVARARLLRSADRISGPDRRGGLSAGRESTVARRGDERSRNARSAVGLSSTGNGALDHPVGDVVQAAVLALSWRVLV
jgi:hypothetical protein